MIWEFLDRLVNKLVRKFKMGRNQVEARFSSDTGITLV